jgi:hypothetical protein
MSGRGNGAGRIFARKREANPLAAKKQLPKINAPEVLTATRAPTVLTREQAIQKKQEVITQMVAGQMRMEEEEGQPHVDAMLEWPENPVSFDALLTALLDSMTSGTAHLSRPVDAAGNRRVIWRGWRTRLLLPPEIYVKKFGIPKDTLIQMPYENSVSIGLIEPARR